MELNLHIMKRNFSLALIVLPQTFLAARRSLKQDGYILKILLVPDAESTDPIIARTSKPIIVLSHKTLKSALELEANESIKTDSVTLTHPT